MEHRLDHRSTAEWRRIAILIGIATIGRLVLGATIGLGVDESYAVAVARPLSLSYFDHPPLVFWIAGVTGMVAGSYRALVLRTPFILLFAATTWVMFRLATRLFGPRAGWFTVVVLTITPVFSLSDGGWILPDGPLLLGMSLTVLCLSHAMDDGSDANWRWWIGAGASAGVASLSKYHAVFLLFGAMLMLLTQPVTRRWLRRPQLYVALLLAAIMALPVFIWNAQHDWVSLRFQLGRGGGGGGGLHAGSFVQNLGGQALYLLPWTWAALLWLLWRAMRRGPRDGNRWLLTCFAIGPIAVFTLLSLRAPGLPHWPAPGYLFLVPLLGDAMARCEARRGAAVTRRLVVGAAAAFLALTVVAVSEIKTGWMNAVAPRMFSRGDPSLEAVDWSELRPELSGLGLLDSSTVVGARNWITCAKVGYAIAPHPVRCFTDDPRHFRFSGAGASSASSVAVIERLDPDQVAWATLPPTDTLPAMTLLTVVPVRRGGQDVLRLAVYGGSAGR